MKKLTIFTPTYNRAYILSNLYNSLKAQTNKEFIWLIIDDGSTDNTEELVSSFIKDSSFDIKYYKKENGGKNTAIDYANNICETPYITCFDSDDTVTKDCVKVILDKISSIDADSKCAGIVSIREMINSPTNLKESAISLELKEELYGSYNLLYKNFGFYPETIIVLKTQIAMESRFPKIPDEKFITEAVYYDPIFRKYNLLLIKEKIYTTEYLEDGYTAMKMGLFFKNPKGYLYYLKQHAFFSIEDKEEFKERIKNVARYIAWKKFMGLKKYKIDEYNFSKLYYLMGYIFHHKFYREYRKEFKNNINTIK